MCIDPYHTKQRLPELLAEYLIGLPLPAQNTADVLAVVVAASVAHLPRGRRGRHPFHVIRAIICSAKLAVVFPSAKAEMFCSMTDHEL